MFSLFQTEGYGSKTALISANEYICINQNHTAKVDLELLQKCEIMADCPLRSEFGAYTNILHVRDPTDQNQKYIYRLSRNKKVSVLMRLDIKENVWEQLGETNHDKDMNGYVNLLAMFSGRVIAILGDRMPKFYDTVKR